MKTVIVLGMHGTPPRDFPREEMAEFFGSGGAHHHEEHPPASHNSEHPQPHTHSHSHSHPTAESHNGQVAVIAPATQDEARRAARRKRKAELEAKMRAWPRTPANDPFHAGSYELADHLSRVSGLDVVVGFNEFCNPTVDDAIEDAVARGADKIVLITPMMTRGGEHSESDIPAAMHRAQAIHPTVQMVYAWPFDITSVAQFLSGQVQRFAE
jgi:sirohydrochlorin cobaltochelatase